MLRDAPGGRCLVHSFVVGDSIAPNPAKRHIALRAFDHRSIIHQPRMACRAGVEVDLNSPFLTDDITVEGHTAVLVALYPGVLIPLWIPDIGKRVIETSKVFRRLEYEFARLDP